MTCHTIEKLKEQETGQIIDVGVGVDFGEGSLSAREFASDCRTEAERASEGARSILKTEKGVFSGLKTG